jgi:hypothetical protein
MVADEFLSPQEHLVKTRRYGVPLDHYNKLSIFNPDAISETRYEIGRHRAVPQGRIRYPEQDRLLLLHYKFLGLDYLLRRYALLSRGLGTADKERRWGFQYDLPRRELEAEFELLRHTAVGVISKKARNLEREKWWRP